MTIKVILEFDENDPFSMERLKVIASYDDYPIAIWDIKQVIREAQDSGRLGNKLISEMSGDEVLEEMRKVVYFNTQDLPMLS